MGLPSGYESAVAELDRLMAPLAAEQLVWRGASAWRYALGLASDCQPADAVGARFQEPGFTCVACERASAVPFSDGEVILRLRIPAGTQAVDIRETNEQRELLLERNLSFQVTGIEANDGYQVLDVGIASKASMKSIG